MINCYIIGNRGSLRSATLSRYINNELFLEKFKVTFISPVYLNAIKDREKITKLVDTSKVLANIGRGLTVGELGCAIAHNHARQQIFESGEFGLVLEDDAELVSIENLIEVLGIFGNKYKLECPVILSLNSGISDKHFETKKIFRVYSPMDLAVGYFLSPAAARLLFLANSPIQNVADWPSTSAKFYVPFNSLVTHIYDASNSAIDLHNSNNNSKRPENSSMRIKNYSMSFSRARLGRSVRYRISKIVIMNYRVISLVQIYLHLLGERIFLTDN